MANEKRLIDANALLASPLWDSLKDDFDKAKAKIIILSAPTVDAVEVVRCKDCEHCRLPWLEGQEFGKCMLGRTMIVELDHFCSYGERREGE